MTTTVVKKLDLFALFVFFFEEKCVEMHLFCRFLYIFLERLVHANSIWHCLRYASWEITCNWVYFTYVITFGHSSICELCCCSTFVHFACEITKNSFFLHKYQFSMDSSGFDTHNACNFPFFLHKVQMQHKNWHKLSLQRPWHFHSDWIPRNWFISYLVLFWL